METKYIYRLGAFVDFKGLKHQYIICAEFGSLPTNPENTNTIFSEYGLKNPFEDEKLINKSISYFNKSGIINYCLPLKAYIKVGIAICHPNDEYNYKLGLELARKKANESKSIVYTTRSGMVQEKLANTLLKQEEQYLWNNPGVYIKGYNYAKKRYFKLK